MHCYSFLSWRVNLLMFMCCGKACRVRMLASQLAPNHTRTLKTMIDRSKIDVISDPILMKLQIVVKLWLLHDFSTVVDTSSRIRREENKLERSYEKRKKCFNVTFPKGVFSIFWSILLDERWTHSTHWIVQIVCYFFVLFHAFLYSSHKPFRAVIRIECAVKFSTKLCISFN
jgi:hypothetical protein